MLIRARTHIFVIVLALVIGIIYTAPNVYHARTAEYQGIVMAEAPDEDFYLSNINKNYESVVPVGDPFQYEYRNDRNPFQFFGIEFLFGKIGTLFHLPIDVLLEIMEFLFPALLTLVVYAFIYRLSGSRLASFFTSGAVLLGNEIVRPSSISNVLNTFLLHGQYGEFLNYSRPISPQVNGLFFFLVIGFLLYLLRNPRSKLAAILCGAAVGLLIYVYIYFWGFTFVLLGVMFLYALIVRKWELALAGGIALVSNTLFMAPFLLANLPIFLHGGASAITQAIPTHRIIIEKMILGPLFLYTLVYLWAWYSGGHGKVGAWAFAFAKKYLFVLFLLITGVIVSNQQVLTGKMVFQEHFHFFTNIPMLLISMSILCYELLTFLNLRWRVICVGIMVAVLAWFSIGVQVSSYKAHSVESARYQHLAPVFSYLRNQGTPQAVLLSNWYLSTRLTIYTQDFAYSSGGIDTTFEVPRERIIHDYFVMLALKGVTAENVRDYMYQKAHREEIGGAIFIGTYWRDFCGSYSCFPDSVLEDLIPQYQAFLGHPLLENIKKYKIDYVLVDKVEDIGWKNVGLIVGKPLYTSGDFTLYAIHQ